MGNERINEWPTGGRVTEDQPDGWTDERMDEWTNGRMDEWTNGWLVDACTYRCRMTISTILGNKVFVN